MRRLQSDKVAQAEGLRVTMLEALGKCTTANGPHRHSLVCIYAAVHGGPGLEELIKVHVLCATLWRERAVSTFGDVQREADAANSRV